jgi:hypothetical protein
MPGASIPYGQGSSLLPGKNRGTKIMQIFTKVWGKVYENTDQTFFFVVTASKSRVLIMHEGCLLCLFIIVFLS